MAITGTTILVLHGLSQLFAIHLRIGHPHYNDVIMASQITSAPIVCTTVCSGGDQRKHQSSASLAFVRGIHRWPVSRKMFPFVDVIMPRFPDQIELQDSNPSSCCVIWFMGRQSPVESAWLLMMDWDLISAGTDISRGPFHERFFHGNSNSMEISFCSHPSCSTVIAVKFCTWHDSCAVVARAKFCSDIIP